MEWIGEHPEFIFLVGSFLLSAVGGLMIWEFKKLHNRIDKYVEKMDKHMEESTVIQTDLAVLKNIHKQNGQGHGG